MRWVHWLILVLIPLNPRSARRPAAYARAASKTIRDGGVMVICRVGREAESRVAVRGRGIGVAGDDGVAACEQVFHINGELF